MGDKTKISWADATWNPTVGCTRVSFGCDNCYAFALHDRRYAANLATATVLYGPMVERIEHSRRKHPDRLPFPRQYDQPFSKVQLLPDRLDQPLRWRKPRRIFVDSMADLFHEDVSDEFIGRVWDAMLETPQHIYQVLTKRPQRMREFVTGWGRQYLASSSDIDYLPHVWLGVSVEDQQTADERIPLLLETPGAVRFVSCEPLLAPVDLASHLPSPRFLRRQVDGGDLVGLDWVIVGGESGPRYRPMELAWAQSIRDQCRSAGVAYFGKQAAGGRPGLPLPGALGDKEFPEDRSAPGGGLTKGEGSG